MISIMVIHLQYFVMWVQKKVEADISDEIEFSFLQI